MADGPGRGLPRPGRRDPPEWTPRNRPLHRRGALRFVHDVTGAGRAVWRLGCRPLRRSDGRMSRHRSTWNRGGSRRQQGRDIALAPWPCRWHRRPGNAGITGVAGGQWRGLDSNQRRRKPTDLQSVPFSHSGTPPQSCACPRQRVARVIRFHHALSTWGRGSFARGSAFASRSPPPHWTSGPRRALCDHAPRPAA